MIAFKACPRCRGDLVFEGLIDEKELVCLQCGYHKELKPSEPALTGQTAGRAP